MDEVIFRLLIKHRPMKNTLGIFDHWFLESESPKLEIHMGNYAGGTHRCIGNTKNSHTYSVIYLCEDCNNKILKNTSELERVFYFPFINCETLASVNFGILGFSVQVLFAITFLLCLLIGAFYKTLYLYFSIFILIVYLVYSKYTYSHKHLSQVCKHIEVTDGAYRIRQQHEQPSQSKEECLARISTED